MTGSGWDGKPLEGQVSPENGSWKITGDTSFTATFVSQKSANEIEDAIKRVSKDEGHEVDDFSCG